MQVLCVESITVTQISFFREEPIDYGELETSLRKTCAKLGVKDVEGFIHKCIQLYETTVVRHGLMLVGPTGSGKTKVCVYQIDISCMVVTTH